MGLYVLVCSIKGGRRRCYTLRYKLREEFFVASVEAGQLVRSQTHLERALKLDPQNSIARDNLEEVQTRLAEKPNR